MRNIIINDLEISKELTPQALQELRGGGHYWPVRPWRFPKDRLNDYLSTQPNTIQPITYVPYKISTL